MLRFDLCDFSDAYIFVKGAITIVRPNGAKKNKTKTKSKLLHLKTMHHLSIVNCISKIHGMKIDNAEDLDAVMPMYNLLEYKKNCEKNNRKFVELL